MSDDILLGLKDIKNYHHPNFIGKNRKLYLVRCYECDKEYGRENYVMNVSAGVCTWCGWAADQEIVDAIVNRMMEELRNDPYLTLDKIKEKYPHVYEAAVERAEKYTSGDTEDDGYPD